MKFANVLWLFCSIAVGLIVLEHGARVSHLEWRPSVGLTYLGDQAIVVFTNIGKLLANISSFYTWINLDELWRTIQDLFVPLVRLCSSPLYTIKGYLSVMVQYKYPILIGLGSCTLVGLVLFVVGKWFGINYSQVLEHVFEKLKSLDSPGTNSKGQRSQHIVYEHKNSGGGGD